MTDVQTHGELAPRHNISDIKIGHQRRCWDNKDLFIMSLFPFINNLSFIDLASRLIYLFIFCYSNQNLRLTGKYGKYFLFALFIIL